MLQPIELSQSTRLINHGPTVLVSAQHGGSANVMAVGWSCALDYAPPRLTVVLDKGAFTRGLVEQGGWFAVQVPVAGQAEMVMALGSQSRKRNPAKLADCGAELFYQEDFDVPLVKGCAAYLVCRLLPEPHNQQSYDLFIGEVAAAWADDRVYADGRWLFDSVPDGLKTLHYVGNGQFYRTGSGLKVG
ncbi:MULTISPECIES: flavin reductase family protein [Eikenella]|uniref:Flavin reductase n=1 Tax=Eikenella longinqua TaxID=1795827 RepID=A0A1A9RTW6_9NEIS|nr:MULTISPECIES: flavin reductase family protein [Eikenella]OAM26334.1 flavin reductase [Eikenella longinqua]